MTTEGEYRPFQVSWRVVGSYREGIVRGRRGSLRRGQPIYDLYALGTSEVWARSEWAARTRAPGQVLRQINFEIPSRTIDMSFNVTKVREL